MTSIRQAAETDIPQITSIYAHYVVHTDISFETVAPAAEEMLRRFRDITPYAPYLVAIDAGGNVVGYCYAHPWKERAAYCHTLETTVYLAPTVCGHGIGTQLMQALIEACRRSTDAHVLIACITHGNEASCRLHAAVGFTQVSHFHQVGRKGGRWLDVVDYELVL